MLFGGQDSSVFPISLLFLFPLLVHVLVLN